MWVHLVWSTKDRAPMLGSESRKTIFSHIEKNAHDKGIYLDCINGVADHIHALISLGASQTISKVLQLLKGESSHWINDEKLVRGKFEWQDEYFAVSVSESVVDKVREYIRNQEAHHRRITFEEESKEFIMKYGFAWQERQRC